MTFYHFLPSAVAHILLLCLIVSFGLKVKVKVILIVLIIGSHGERKIGTCYMSGIVLGVVQHSPKF